MNKMITKSGLIFSDCPDYNAYHNDYKKIRIKTIK